MKAVANGNTIVNRSFSKIKILFEYIYGLDPIILTQGEFIPKKQDADGHVALWFA